MKITTYNLLFYFILGWTLFSCTESEKLLQLREEIAQAERTNAALVKESKANGYKVNQELQRNLEAHAILVLSYFQDEGEVDLEMTGKMIEYMEYYQENSDYLKTDPSYQSYLPMIYGIQSSLYSKSGDRTLAIESVKQSLRGFEELIEDFPDDPMINIYYAITLGSVPKILKTDKKALKYHLQVDKILVDNSWEDNVPISLRKKLYQKAIELLEKIETEFDSGIKKEYFKNKLADLKKISG